MIRSRHLLFSALYFLLHLSLSAQTIKGYSKEQVEEFSAKVEDQVRFLEYLLNTVGSAETSARDKDIIIRESYLKIFRDEKVQVEDDLLLDRKVVTNKDVTAYIKDIEFFYKNVEFKFKIRDVKASQKENGEVYFLASLDRTITATSVSGEKITNTKPRFVEVNLQDKSQELKIVSVYTTKVSRDEELTAWWEGLDSPWKNYFRGRFELAPEDSISLDWLYRFVSVDSLNISGRREIFGLQALSELRDLKVVDISNTAITDLGPISNVTFLESLNLTNTPTSDIQFIKYSDRLKHLDISNTGIEDISQLLNLKSLVSLKAENTPIMSFAVLNEFKNLIVLDLGSSGFNNLENIKDLNMLESLDLSDNYMINFSALSGLVSLKSLDLSNTNVQDVSSLEGLSNLESLDISGSQVADISPLESLPNLKKISADETQLTAEAADSFVRKKPSVLLIHHVKDLESWWAALSPEWKAALKKNNPRITSDDPGIETLTQTVTMPELNLDGDSISDLVPITRFVNLASLDFSNNPVADLFPLSEVKTLTKLTGKNTQVADLSALRENKVLEYIDLENSPVASITDIVALPKLVYLNVNGGDVSVEEVPGILAQMPDLNLVYRTDELSAWWDGLDPIWKDVFREKFSLGESPETEQLHRLASQPELKFERLSIPDLKALSVFDNLRSLEVFDTPISSVAPLSGLNLLTKLRLSQVAVTDFLPISGLSLLQELDLSNTGIEDLSPISNLRELKKLNISGTNLKTLKGLEPLIALEELDVASTNLRSLKPLDGITSLRKLSCFNTNLSSRAVDSFKSSHPDCEVRYY
ncbi:leucine-rich repeat domain-containing protein [Algoriphagus aestuariicola]|uniref:Leucine-rich repeat domain-containing protein n=1 Tax=Algoriphagus aestuariicola TaxID=1852016 RepID=A0ABS3BKX7_9BACT|nr:leucine-rich repeat domain-containing protein [Algoriphagus aestuariicola]MBN7799937.1 leucine-rich repeat domain-containing protein [Algoriphagus aestuariicola]